MPGKFEIIRDKAGKFRFRLKAVNGEIIADSEAYESLQACKKGIDSVRNNASDAVLDENVEEKTSKKHSEKYIKIPFRKSMKQSGLKGLAEMVMQFASMNLTINYVDLYGQRNKVSVTKPPETKSDIKVPAIGEHVPLKYCEIQDLPLKKMDSLQVATIFDVDIETDHFAGDMVLDSLQYDTPREVNFIELLKEYGKTNGRTVYFYKPLFKDIQQFNMPYKTNWSYHDGIQYDLFKSTMKTLLYIQGYDSMSDEEMFHETINFRNHVLGWKIIIENEEFHISHISYGYSNYPPEVLERFILGLTSFKESMQYNWEINLNYLKKTNINLDKTLKNIEKTYGEIEEAETELVDVLSLIIQIKQLLLKGKSENLKRYVVGYTTKKNLPPELPGLPHLVETETDVVIVNKYEVYHEESPEEALQSLSLLKKRLEDVIEVYDSMNENQCSLVKYQPGYYVFLEDLEKEIDNKIQDGTTSPKLVAKLKSLIEERGVKTAQIAHIDSLLSMVYNGTLYLLWVKYAMDMLKMNCEQRTLMTESYIPLLIGSTMGAFGELPAQPYYLEPISPHRENDFYEFKPQVGLLKEYRMQIMHKGFGIGRHLYSQTLFPGEEVSIEMRSYQKTTKEITESSAEKIFEESDSSTQKDFLRELKDNMTKNTDHSSSTTHRVGAEMEANIMSYFKMGANYSGEWSSKDEENVTAENFEKTMDNLSTKLSDKRQITFEIQRNEKSTTVVEDELKSTRTFNNINKEKTLTFNFFQITREYETSLWLKDLKFYYQSGKYRILKIFTGPAFNISAFQGEPEFASLEEKLTELGLSLADLEKQKVIEKLPAEVWKYYPDDALIFILTPPYSVKIPLSVTNAFLASNFDLEKAKEINQLIRNVIGGGAASPDGLAVAAFPFTKDEQTPWPVDDDGNPWPEAESDNGIFVTDLLKINANPSILPNIDIRYSITNNMATRYFDETGNGKHSLPKLTWWKNYVINTNGVYCENMLGKCGALEGFATEHRRLDVEMKKHEVEKAKALLPPSIEDFTIKEGKIDEKAYEQALNHYRTLKQLDSEKILNVKAPDGSEVKVNLTLSNEDSSENINIEE